MPIIVKLFAGAAFAFFCLNATAHAAPGTKTAAANVQATKTNQGSGNALRNPAGSRYRPYLIIRCDFNY